MMLYAIPKRWFSWNFYVCDGARQVAEIDVAWWREKGLLTLEGISYQVYREKMMSGAFILKTAGEVVARAEKPDALLRRLLVDYGGRQFTLKAESAFGRGFILLEGQKGIGRVAPEGFFTRRAAASLPEELPLAVKIFILWLVIILWKRESDSGTAS
jgi:hypothetical protein